MANQVYANMMEVSCKAAAGKSICAFPDVCMTPPMTPATPPGVPIPYPNTGMASDCTSGSSTVKISGQEVMLKNKSYFKRSMGDEAGAAPKKGVVTSANMGKVYFTMWSMDVKVEGENVVRMMDMTTHNHASMGPNSPPWAYLDEVAMSTASAECKAQAEKTSKCVEKHVKANTTQDNRAEHKTPGATRVAAIKDDAKVDWAALLQADGGKNEFYNKKGTTRDMCEDPECKDQFECNLLPFDFGCCKAEKGEPGEMKTPHHIVPAHCFMPPGVRNKGGSDRYPGTESYVDTKAPCICLEGHTKSSVDKSNNIKQHGQVHAIVDPAEDAHLVLEQQYTPSGKPRTGASQHKEKAGTWNFEQANEAGSDAVSKVTGCPKECLKAQSEAAHKKMGLDVGPGKSEKLTLRADSSGGRPPPTPAPPSAVTAPGAE